MHAMGSKIQSSSLNLKTIITKEKNDIVIENPRITIPLRLLCKRIPIPDNFSVRPMAMLS